jgi:hypothetical protein
MIMLDELFECWLRKASKEEASYKTLIEGHGSCCELLGKENIPN